MVHPESGVKLGLVEKEGQSDYRVHQDLEENLAVLGQLGNQVNRVSRENVVNQALLEYRVQREDWVPLANLEIQETEEHLAIWV